MTDTRRPALVMQAFSAALAPHLVAEGFIERADGKTFVRKRGKNVHRIVFGSSLTAGRHASLRRVRYTERMSEADRRARADARRLRGMVVERIESLDAPAAYHDGESVEQRLTAMTRLCRAAWLATGQPLPPSGRANRSSLPGEVYIPPHAGS